MLTRMLFSGAMGAAVGAGGVIAGSMIQVGRAPAMQQVAGAAAMMGTIFGVGSVVRQR